MRERVVCDMDGDHLPNQEVEQEKIVAVPHIPRKEERMWESEKTSRRLKKGSKRGFCHQATALWKLIIPISLVSPSLPGNSSNFFRLPFSFMTC